MTYEDRVRKQLEINEVQRVDAALSMGSPGNPPTAKMRGKKVKPPSQKGMKKKSGMRC